MENETPCANDAAAENPKEQVRNSTMYCNPLNFTHFLPRRIFMDKRFADVSHAYGGKFNNVGEESRRRAVGESAKNPKHQ